MADLHQNTSEHLRSAITNEAASDEIETLLTRINGGGDGSVPTAQASYVTAVESGDGVLHKTEITITNLPIATTDAGAAGAHGTVKLYDFPEGHIKIHGALLNLTSIAAGAGGIADAGVLDVGVGSATVGTGDETLGTTEQNIVTKKDVTLSGGVVANQSSLNSTDVAIDGTSTAVDANLNVAVENASSTANDTITVSGTLTMLWSNLGDV